MVLIPKKDNREQTTDVTGAHQSFIQLGVDRDVCQALIRMGITKTFPIQEQTFKPIMEGNDVIGISKNGTGKTLAILVPALCLVNPRYKSKQILIVTNTHENEQQIYDVLKQIISYLPENSQKKKITFCLRDRDHKKETAQIMITTEKNAYSIIKYLRTNSIERIFYDEYDQYFGNIDEEQERYEQLFKLIVEKDILTTWFTATPNRYVNGLIYTYLKKPTYIDVTGEKRLLVGLQLYYAECTDQNRKRILVQALKNLKIDQCIIFCNKYSLEELQEYIQEHTGIPCIIIQNDDDRTENFQQFAERKYRICLTTNLIARGIDIRTVNAVIHYDTPNSYSKFVQRSGRAGRAGHYGFVLTFVTPQSKETWMKIMKVGQLKIDEDIKKLPGNLDDIEHDWEYDEDDIII